MMKRHLKWIISLTTLLLVLVIPLSNWWRLAAPFKSFILNPQKTGITTLNFYDASRNRPLTTEIWYPIDPHVPAQAANGVWIRCDEARDSPLSEARAQYPLVIISHGSGGDRFNISWLAEVLSANGYIVAAMDHFGNTWNNKIPFCYARPWERPKDVSFVLDQLLTDSLFKDRIDPTRIGFAGYSLGGATGIWIAGATASEFDTEMMKAACSGEFGNIVPPEVIESIDFKEACHSFFDPRFSSMFVMAPALGWLFEEESLAKIKIPIYIVAPENDQIVPLENNAKILAKTITTASLKVLTGDATHFVFLNRATLVGRRFLDAKYCEDPETIDRQTIHEELAATALRFFSNIP